MALLSSLGIDHTIFIQFGIFALAFFTMTFALYKPYLDAYEQREAKTTGGEQAAEEIIKKAGDLRVRYETRAREVNGEIKKIFDGYREEASRESEKIVSKAKNEAQQLIDQARNKVTAELSSAQAKMKDEVPVLAKVIVSKLLSKNV